VSTVPSAPYDQPSSIIRPVVCEWDGSSCKPGPSRNTDVWQDVLAEVDGLAPPVVLNRRLGELLPTALTACVSLILDAGEQPLILGGDHRVSYSALTAVTHCVGSVKVHLFDAHHDAHPGQVLTNFSVFHFATHRLGLRGERYGCREGGPRPSPAPVAMSPGRAHYAYVTVDLDYLDPAVFSSVSFPVKTPPGMECTVDVLAAEVWRIGGELPIIGCDLVEWCGNRATNEEKQQVITALRALQGAMAKK